MVVRSAGRTTGKTMSQFDQKTLSIIAKLGASVKAPELKPIGQPAVTGAKPPLKIANTPVPLSQMPCPPKSENCPPPSTAYAAFEAPVVTPICDTGPLVKENYSEAFGMAMQLFEHACACIRSQNDISVVNASQQFTGARIP